MITNVAPDAGTARRRADRARQVADALRPALLDRTNSSPLPGEAELAADFAVSRNTVRQALDLLRAEGLIERTPGVGTRTLGGKFEHSIDHLAGLAETLAGHDDVHNQVRVKSLIPAPASVAARLGINAGDPVVYVERLRLAGGWPISLDLTYLVADLGEPLLDQDLAGRDIFALIEGQLDQPLGGAEVALEATRADEHSAEILDVRPGAPLLLLERLTHTADGRPVDLEFIRFRGDRITMRGTVQRHPARSTEGAQS